MKLIRSLTTPLNQSTNRLRLLLGDQLNSQHTWFKEKQPNVVYLIAELKQETDYVKHHIQKVCAFFSAMASFAQALAQSGHQVIYLTLDETKDFKSLTTLLNSVIEHHAITHFEYQRPDEYRLLHQLSQFRHSQVSVEQQETEHFLLGFDDIPKMFKPGKTSKMEFFYRKMRKRMNILMEDNQPLGGKWNYDAENRCSFKQQEVSAVPKPKLFENNVEKVVKRLNKHQIKTFGKSVAAISWPIDRAQSLALLDYFCRFALPQFGKFQDAMTKKSDYGWSLYHSRISFSLNAKLISPLEVVQRTVSYWEKHKKEISLAQIEGFVRQIIGWREFVRGIYWINMPDYAKQNYLGAKKTLPSFFWTGETKMNCLHHAISQSLDYAYAHHIQRLMLTGNFCLLTGINPDEVDQWYLGIYIDAIEWVEMPNTRGMTQFADQGIVATKPYAASGSYINKMSDYCKSCHYKVKNKTEEDACPFNSLYWHFINKHEKKFKSNPRMSMIYKSWHKMEENKKNALINKAKILIKNIDSI